MSVRHHGVDVCVLQHGGTDCSHHNHSSLGMGRSGSVGKDDCIACINGWKEFW